jgi:hypothetical protein
MRYLREIVMTHSAHKVLLEESIMAITAAEQRVARLTDLIHAHVEQWDRKPLVEALMGFKGIQLLTAITLLSEIGDILRFGHPRQLMAFLGLVPSEYSSGDNPAKRGKITKCGNRHARWFLIECAQHYALAPKVSKDLAQRQKGLSQRMKELSWNAQTRLNKRYHALIARGKNRQKTMTAIARELLGFIWAMLREHSQPGSVTRKTAPAQAAARQYPLTRRHGASTPVKRESGITPLRSGPQGALIPVLS